MDGEIVVERFKNRFCDVHLKCLRMDLDAFLFNVDREARPRSRVCVPHFHVPGLKVSSRENYLRPIAVTVDQPATFGFANRAIHRSLRVSVRLVLSRQKRLRNSSTVCSVPRPTIDGKREKRFNTYLARNLLYSIPYASVGHTNQERRNQMVRPLQTIENTRLRVVCLLQGCNPHARVF